MCVLEQPLNMIEKNNQIMFLSPFNLSYNHI